MITEITAVRAGVGISYTRSLKLENQKVWRYVVHERRTLCKTPRLQRNDLVANKFNKRKRFVGKNVVCRARLLVSSKGHLGNVGSIRVNNLALSDRKARGLLLAALLEFAGDKEGNQSLQSNKQTTRQQKLNKNRALLRVKYSAAYLCILQPVHAGYTC